MKKLIAFLTICCCALAFAAKPPDQNEPTDQTDTKKPAQKSKAVPKQPVVPQEPRTLPKTKVEKPHTERSTNVVPKNEPTAAPTVESEKPTDLKSKKTQKTKQAPAETTTTEPAKEKTTKTAPSTSTAAPTTAPTAPPAANTTVNNPPATSLQKNKVKVDPAVVSRIRQQHANFKAQPKTTVASVQFNQNYRIQAAQNWTGPQYNVFRTYQPQWHDRGWWSSHYSTVLLIGGGWYYWDAGYWRPAWGYDEAAAYYPYDGPIYVGSSPRPFDQVVADVQAVLQEQGYYKGEVDGLVGPLTREALTAYQEAQGLPPTASIDEPTLESLGLT